MSAASCCCQEAAGLCTQTGEWERATRGWAGFTLSLVPGSLPPRGWSRPLWEPPGKRPREGDLSGLRCPVHRAAARRRPGCMCGGPASLAPWHGFLFGGSRRLRVYGNGGLEVAGGVFSPTWTATLSLPGAGAPGQPRVHLRAVRAPGRPCASSRHAEGAGLSDPSPNPIPTQGGGQRRTAEWRTLLLDPEGERPCPTPCTPAC